MNGKPLDIRHPSDAIAAGIALIPEDRRKQGLVPVMDVERNFGLANYRQYAPSGFLRLKQRRQGTNRYIEEMAIRPRRAEVRIRNLSGGNQQKVIETDGIREVADYNPAIQVSIEYKPSEPRAFSLLGDLGMTLLAIKKVGRPNLGVTLDFAHVLYAGEPPAFAAAMIQRESQLLGIHLNDGYGRRDDGLMAGTVNLVQTLELLFQLSRKGFDGVIYFDTFPDVTGLDPVGECENNIAMVDALWKVARRLTEQPELREAISQQDAVMSQKLVRQAILGA